METKSLYRDCTNTFKNRVASFEYSYYPGYWMYPSPTYGNKPRLGWAVPSSLQADTTYQWILHACGDSLCMESKRTGWDNYFINYYFLDKHANNFDTRLDTNLHRGSNHEKWVKIMCTSCNPDYSFTYGECQIMDVGKKYRFFSTGMGLLMLCKDCGDSSWFKWRIQSPPTRQYWAEVVNICNKGSTITKYTRAFKSSITTSLSQTQTWSVSAKINFGIAAGKLINALSSLGGESSTSYSYSRTELRQSAEEVTHTLEKDVQPGYRWIVKQFVGEAAYTTIKTTKYMEDDNGRC